MSLTSILSFLGKSGGADKASHMASAGGTAGGILDAFSPQAKVNEDFITRNQNIQTQLNRASGLSSGLANAGLQSGNPIAMGVGAALKVGDALTKSATDEYGVVDDSAKAIVGGIMNPIQGLSTLIGQRDRREARDRFVNRGVASEMTETTRTGNAISNSLPEYKSPGYGKNGMKLTTKFSNRNGKSKF